MNLIRSFHLAYAPSGRNNGSVPDNETSVYIVDDHPAVHEALRAAIGREPALTVIAGGATAEEALDDIRQLTPDVAIVDISLEGGDGLTLIEEIRSEVPSARVLVFSMYHESVYAERAIRAGALGYVPKTEPTSDVIEAIHTVAGGEVYLSEDITSQILGKVIRKQDYAITPVERLTDRELTVFRMLGEGHSVRDIAEQLTLSRKTIETYRRRAKDKLGYDTVDELLRYAVQWTGGHEQKR